MNDKTRQDDITSETDNSRIIDVEEITTPKELVDSLPLDETTAEFIRLSRDIVSNIIHLKDNRLLVITGPCSIHNPEEALQIAKNLKVMQEANPYLYIVMRTYFEKPRTTVGWKGLLNDPNLDDSRDIEKWLRIGRELLLEINKMWVPTAVEFLDTQTPQYIADLVHWGAIGARTTESQEHRKLVSGLSMPVGFKNATNGDIGIALDAIESAQESHAFIGTSKSGRTARLTTSGNPDGHVILRWGSDGPNYDMQRVWAVEERLKEKWIDTGIVIDFSHANSWKKHENQPKVSRSVAEQIADGNKRIVWVMIEANIHEGAQKHTAGKDNPKDIKPGISITDACVSLETNEEMLTQLNDAAEKRNKS